MIENGFIRNQAFKKCIGIDNIESWERGSNLKLKSCSNVKRKWEWFTTG